MTDKNIIIVTLDGQWFVRKVELWNTPTFYELNDKDESLKYLGNIALDPKYCDNNFYEDKALFASEAEALEFIKIHFEDVSDLKIGYVYPNGQWNWDVPTV